MFTLFKTIHYHKFQNYSFSLHFQVFHNCGNPDPQLFIFAVIISLYFLLPICMRPIYERSSSISVSICFNSPCTSRPSFVFPFTDSITTQCYLVSFNLMQETSYSCRHRPKICWICLLVIASPTAVSVPAGSVSYNLTISHLLSKQGELKHG